ncbi:histidine phosphatase family protein [Pseudomonas sp. NPDC007930]|uniref:lipopolysaccharide core heptose(II)-phosphate phosphatase PmrG n=1 Tax=Pseudomonas sp. NPDC007930 TaxID=3364417 RepID=UPI0036E42EB5
MSLWLAALLYALGVWAMLGPHWQPLPKLASQLDTASFGRAWAAGQVIVLVRHEQRCDRSSHACLGPADGITEEGDHEAAALGAAYAHLDLARADLYHSPRARTAQSAGAMFSARSLPREWAATCNGQWQQALRDHKEAGRNLVVVTHSECMGRTLKALQVRAGDPGYGSSLFLRVGADGSLTPLALLDAPAWIGQWQPR